MGSHSSQHLGRTSILDGIWIHTSVKLLDIELYIIKTHFGVSNMYNCKIVTADVDDCFFFGSLRRGTIEESS